MGLVFHPPIRSGHRSPVDFWLICLPSPARFTEDSVSLSASRDADKETPPLWNAVPPRRRKNTARRLPVAITVSAGLHAVALVVLMNAKWLPLPRPERFTDAPGPELVVDMPLGPGDVKPVVAEEPSPVQIAKNEPSPEPVAEQPPEAVPEPPVTPIEATPVITVKDPDPKPVATAPVEVPVVTPSGTPITATPSGNGNGQGAPKPTAPVTFAGIKAARAGRVVYVVDASGPMTSSLPFVRQELLNSVGRLTDSQLFQVIVFRVKPPKAGADGRVVEPGDPEVVSFSAGGPVVATTEQKLRLTQWVDENIKPGGGSNPLPGLEKAFENNPDLIFLLTRGISRSGTQWGAGKEATLAAMERMNPVNYLTKQRNTVVKAIQFVDHDPTGLMQDLAAAHGDGPGSYRVVKVNGTTGRPAN